MAEEEVIFTEQMKRAPGEMCWLSVLSCLLLACCYVGSLYVWRSDLPRDHPAVIKRRFTSVLVVSGLSPLFVWAWREFTAVRTISPLLGLLGIRLEGFISAIVLPLLLTMVLFLGPLMQLAMDCPWSFTDGIRVVLAHFHHVIELLRFRQGTLSGIFLSAVFQFSYTAVFGAYTAFIFIRTGHLMGPVLCHSFCNYMGFPAISTALEHPQRLIILSSYLFGVLLFFMLLFPLTDPSFYGAPTPVCTLTSSPSCLCFS
ncbi:CAAX prenyl protease 2 isoform X2 [Girardinichthys multiradiatus]|uniref:CAAX prenyl protease 2 isoform X2 n=1 Tax=Girardinichthys multiradiatus TaxID=208333 RepID=UPI001FAC64F8|nr:CAAX prenyl protease 2 isoform X2 [Girardinichthys multiradiatus]